MQIRATGLTGEKKKSHGLSEPSQHSMLASERMTFFFFKGLFSVRNVSPALVASPGQRWSPNLALSVSLGRG